MKDKASEAPDAAQAGNNTPGRNRSKTSNAKDIVLFFAKGLIVLALALLPGVLAIVGLDPYFFLGTQKTPHIYIPNERFQIPGLARNEEYDTVILGTSMVENFSEKYVGEKLKANAIRLPVNASYVTEQARILDMAEKYHDVKTVLWGIDYRTVDIRFGDVYSKNVKFPEYMYDENPVNDWKYLLDHNNFFWALKQHQIRKTGVNPFNYMVTDREKLNTWTWKRTAKDLIAADYKELYLGRKSIYDKINSLPAGEAKNTIDKTVVESVKKYPDTRFVFFFPPKSILWYKLMDQKGFLEKKLEVLTYFVDRVSAYPNCEIYNFQNVSELTENLDLYLDVTHYGVEGNNYMTDAIAENRHKTDPETFRKDCAELIKRVRSDQIDKLAQDLLK